MGKHHNPTTTLAAILATIALLIAGCGSTNTTTTTTATTASQPTNTTPPTSTPATNPTTPTSTSTQPAKTETGNAEEGGIPTEAKIVLSSPAVAAEANLPSKYTCDGQNTPLPLRWKGIPPGTKELTLDILKTQPVNGKLYYAWAITGLKPNTTGINPPTLPPGTITGTNSDGHTTYNICPPKGKPETYVAVLFALTHHIPTQQGFNPKTLRKQALHTAKYEAILPIKYTQH